MTLAVAPVSLTASATVSNTGRSRCFSPPRPGVTPPTILVPYLMLCSEWNVPCWPVKPWQITLVFLLTRMLMRLLLSLGCERDGLLRRVREVGGRRDGQRAVRQHLAGLLGVGAFEAHHHRHRHAHLLDRDHHAFCDQVAAHDAAEDVHQDGAHLLVGEDQLEGRGD